MKIVIKNKIYETMDEKYDNYEDLVNLQIMMVTLGFPKIDLKEIEEMWETISDKYCASWLGVPPSKEKLMEFLKCIEI